VRDAHVLRAESPWRTPLRSAGSMTASGPASGGLVPS
jgi:hypothetical protein